MSSLPPFDADRSPGDTEPPDDELLAGEYVLGVLNSDERRRIDARISQDRTFALQVAQWEQRLAPWLVEVGPEPVPTHLWAQLRERLGWHETPPQRPSLWSSLLVWRTATALAILAAFTVWVVHLPTSPTAATKPVTTLAQSNGAPGWLASVDQDRGTIVIIPVPRAADARGRIAELWIIPAGKAPLSLGAVSITRSLTVQVPADARSALTARGSVLAITLEPAAGVPHAAPSGPVIASGPLQT